MEFIEIVDQNGNFTGEIMEKEEAHDKNLLHNEIAIFIVNSKNEILMQKRAATKRFNPNKWGLCAGHVDARETLEDAALRELKEELGIELPKKQLHPFMEREIAIKDTNSHVTYLYYTKLDLKEEDFSIQQEELSEVKWISIDDVILMIKSSENKTTLETNRIIFLEELKKINWK